MVNSIELPVGMDFAIWNRLLVDEMFSDSAATSSPKD